MGWTWYFLCGICTVPLRHSSWPRSPTGHLFLCLSCQCGEIREPRSLVGKIWGAAKSVRRLYCHPGEPQRSHVLETDCSVSAQSPAEEEHGVLSTHFPPGLRTVVCVGHTARPYLCGAGGGLALGWVPLVADWIALPPCWGASASPLLWPSLSENKVVDPLAESCAVRVCPEFSE